MPRHVANSLRETTLPAVLLVGDALAAFGGLSLGYWLRYDSMLGSLGLDVPEARFSAYLPLLLLGVVFLIAAFAQQGLYDGRMLLRKQQNLNLLMRGTARTDGRLQHVAGLPVEIRRHAIDRAPHTTRRHERNVLRPRGLRGAHRQDESRRRQ